MVQLKGPSAACAKVQPGAPAVQRTAGNCFFEAWIRVGGRIARSIATERSAQIDSQALYFNARRLRIHANVFAFSAASSRSQWVTLRPRTSRPRDSRRDARAPS